MVPNIFPAMLTMSIVGMIKTREPQEEMTLLSQSAKKFRPENNPL